MIILEDCITLEEISLIRNFYENNKDRCYVNWHEDNKKIDTRCMILSNDGPAFTIIENIAKKYFDNILDLWAGYQLQTNPHNIHTDDYGMGEDKDVYTFIISFDTIPEFKTYIWKEQASSNQELHRYIANWGEQRSTLLKKSLISQIEDLEHTKDINQNDFICDYLELDGIFTYKRSGGVLFNAKQFHCTSNWVKYNHHKQRELLQIHVSVPTGTAGYL